METIKDEAETLPEMPLFRRLAELTQEIETLRHDPLILHIERAGEDIDAAICGLGRLWNSAYQEAAAQALRRSEAYGVLRIIKGEPGFYGDPAMRVVDSSKKLLAFMGIEAPARRPADERVTSLTDRIRGQIVTIEEIQGE